MKVFNVSVLVTILTVLAAIIAVAIPFFQAGDYSLAAIITLIGAIISAIVAALTRKEARARGL